MKNFLRAYCERTEGGGTAGEPLRFTASTEGLKRDGKDLNVENWNLENYRRNPVFLWAHDYRGRTLPLGRSVVFVDPGKRALTADVSFDQADEFARQVEGKYRNGFLNAVSVGWLNVFRCGKCGEVLQGETTFFGIIRPRGKCPHCEAELKEEEVGVEYELLDISGVPVPGDPGALMERELRALAEEVGIAETLRIDEALMELGNKRGAIKPQMDTDEHGLRGAIPPHSTEKAEEGAGWNGPGEVAKAEGKGQLRRMHAWVDEGMDGETKQAYKLPHHLAEDGKVVWRGVAAAMSRLLQAGTQIPDGDRRGVYNHLARHYGQFDKEAPEFRTVEELEALGEEELRGLFLEGEELISPQRRGGGGEELGYARVGAVLNARNRGDLEQAVELIEGVLARASTEKDENSEALKREEEELLAKEREELAAMEAKEREELAVMEALKARLALV